jgi:hypothetical protein
MTLSSVGFLGDITFERIISGSFHVALIRSDFHVSFAARAFLHFVNHNLTMDLHRK